MARKVRLVTHTWTHADYGDLEVTWDETDPGNPHLVAIQPGFWVPAAEVTELVRVAREELLGHVSRVEPSSS